MKQKITWIFLHYIRITAKLQLLKNNPKIIGLTGSAGKTSTQHAIVAALTPEFKLMYTFNANSETGLPLSILGVTPKNFSIIDWLRIAILTAWKLVTNWEKYDVLVAEMGIDSPLPPKNMGYLLTIVKPDIGILLNAAPMHSETFDFLVTATKPAERKAQLTQLIANEKGKIVTEISKNAIALVNTDQKELTNLLSKVKAKQVLFGENKNATVQILSSSPTLKGTSFTFSINGASHTITLQDYALAHHYAYSIAAATAAALQLGLPAQKSLENISKYFSLEPGRSTLIPGKNGSTILDSSYNSSAKPTVEMLEMLSKLDAKRKLALLGDIREVGSVSRLEHEIVVKTAALHCDAIFLVGPQMKKYALPYLKNKNTYYQWFAKASEAAEFLESFLKRDDILLVKASQNTLLLEIAVERLMANPKDAPSVLCRRGPYWDRRRKELI